MVSVSSPGWILLPFAIAGWILAWRLIAALAGRARRSIRVALFLLLAATWITLLWLWMSPHRSVTETVFHPPVVALAVDRSASFQAGKAGWLGAGDAVQGQIDRVRSHYAGRGFRVREIEFGEYASLAEKHDSLGILTRISALRSFLDSSAISNLQGIFLWSDGRFGRTPDDGIADWPAPLFPMMAVGSGSGEVQGETLILDFSRPDSGLSGNLEWRCLRPGPCAARLELWSAGAKIWSGKISGEMDPDGRTLSDGIRIPRGTRLDPDARWIAVLKPEKPEENAVPWNDTVRVRTRGGRKWRNLFPRPLHSLEERGLMDALRSSDSLEALAMAPDSLESGTREGDVIWLPRKAGARLNEIAARANARGIPVVCYAFAENRASSGFSPEARLAWSRTGDPFLPAGVMRLADLGSAGWELPKMDTVEKRLAWAEEKGRAGRLLSSRNKASLVWDAVIPMIWSTAFQPEADTRLRRNQEEWVQGIAHWARVGGERIRPANPRANADSSPQKPIAVELGLLGIDVQTLAALGEQTRGRLIRMENTDVMAWVSRLPEFSTGQIAEEKSRTTPLASPGVLALIAALLLTALWTIRKLAHLD